MDTGKPFDAGTMAVMAITLVLFMSALFAKGFTHDLLLEAGVFLVSVKLMLMTYHNGLATERMQQKLDEIHAALKSGQGRP
jgi:hypothetical protein